MLFRRNIISQREYGRYVLGLLPAAAAIVFFGSLAGAAVVLPWNQMPRAIMVCQVVGFCMATAGIVMRWVREFLIPPFLPAVPWHHFIGFSLGFVVGRDLVLATFGLDVLHLSEGSNDTALMIVIAGSAVFGSIYFPVRWHMAQEQWRSERAERAAVAARLRSLQAQVEPHFLFNTLANVHALMTQSPQEAKRLLRHLSNYLRTSVSHGRERHTTLRVELAQLEAYLKVMSIRLPDRLTAEVTCKPDCAELPFPPMLLHPLVANAVIHGIEPSLAGGTISVTAYRRDKDVIIDVEDSGIGFGNAPVNPHSNGTGLENVRDRLEALFGHKSELRILDLSSQGTCVRVAIQASALLKLKSHATPGHTPA